MSIKKIIKTFVTCVRHPIVSTKLISEGCYNFYIGPQITINGWAGFNTLHCKDNLYIGRNARLLFVKEYIGKKYDPEICIGKNVCIGNRFSALSAAPIIIGDDCLFASDVLITSENHGMNVEESASYSSTTLEAKSVQIGEGCWLGEKVSIMPGVTLGERTVVAAGAVVTKSFPPYSLVGGVPAKILKTYNFETHQWEKYNE